MALRSVRIQYDTAAPKVCRRGTIFARSLNHKTRSTGELLTAWSNNGGGGWIRRLRIFGRVSSQIESGHCSTVKAGLKHSVDKSFLCQPFMHDDFLVPLQAINLVVEFSHFVR